jgi:heptosyltransferase-2
MEVKRILIRSPNWIGDQILAYPFYRHLRAVYPDAWIAVVCTEWVKDIQFQGLVDEVFILPKNKEDGLFKKFLGLKKFTQKIKLSGPWELGITLPNSFGGALLLKWAEVKNRRGYNTDARGFLLTEKLEWNPDPMIHRAQSYLNLLAPEGLPPYEAKNYWSASDEKNFDPLKYWPNVVPIEPPGDEFFVIAPGATAESRRWTSAQFLELIEKIQAKWGYECVIVGGKAEKEIATEFYRKGLRVMDFTAKGWVAQHWKLFRHAKFTICNESGLAHVASFCGSPVQIVCGAADPKRTKPIGPGSVQVTVNPVECWPCERNVCQYKDERHIQCLKGISPGRVFGEVQDGFKLRP